MDSGSSSSAQTPPTFHLSPTAPAPHAQLRLLALIILFSMMSSLIYTHPSSTSPLASSAHLVSYGGVKVDFSSESNSINLGKTTLLNYTIIFVDFPDAKHSIDMKEVFETLQRLSDYIEEASYGKYMLKFFSDRNWHLLSRNISYYARDLEAFLWDAVGASDPYINFSTAPRLIIVHAGADAVFTNNPNDIRSQYFDVGCGAPARTDDGVPISSAIIVSEFSTLGVYVHEFLHSLGAFDLYGPEGGREAFIGAWDVMATGWRSGSEVRGKFLIVGLNPVHPSAWTKLRTSFLEESDVLVLHPGSHVAEILPLSDQGKGVHVIKIPITSYKYYLIEVRERKGFDSGIPSEGFLVYLANESATDVFNGILRLVDANKNTATLDDAPFRPGGTFYDPEYNLRIRFEKTDGKYRVLVDYNAPNLLITSLPVAINADKIQLKAIVKNTGKASAKESLLYLFTDGILTFKQRLSGLAAGEERLVSYSIEKEPGEHTVLWSIQLLDDKVEVTTSDNNALQEYEVEGERPLKAYEWPEAPAPGTYSWPVERWVDDFDGDGKDEVVIKPEISSFEMNYNYYYYIKRKFFYIVDHDGELIDVLGIYPYLYLDLDGVKEFLGADSEGNLHIISLKKDGKHRIYKGIAGIEKVADLNGDNVKDFLTLVPLDMKVVQSRYGGSLHYYSSINLLAYDGSTGKLMFNVTVTSDSKETFEYSYYKHLGPSWIGSYGLITAEDLDGDGRPEILVGLKRNYWEDTLWYNEREYVLRCFSSDGKLVWTKIKRAPASEIYIVEVSGSKFILFETLLNYTTSLLSANGEVLWTINNYYGKLPDIGETLIGGNLVFIDGRTIRFVDPSNGFIERQIELPSGVIKTATVNLQGTSLLVLGAGRGLYVLNADGDVVADVTFNTYTWFSLIENRGAVVYLYNRSIYFMDFSTFKVSKLFDSMILGNVVPVNIDNDTDTEFLVLGSFIQAYESNGTAVWSFGVDGGIQNGKDVDLDRDGLVDAVFLEGDFEHSVLIFKNGKMVYDLNDCTFTDLNDDGFLEAIAVSNRGLEVYDRAGNIVWSVQGADFREVDIASTSSGETIIAATVGIFARHMDMPPQVRIYSAHGNLLKVIGFYWDPPSVKFVKSTTSGKAYLVVLGLWSRDEYHLEVYNELGALMFDRLVKKISVKDAGLFDVNGDQREELIVPPYVFKLDGELVTNEYQELAKRWELDVNGDGVNEYVEIEYREEKFEIAFKDSSGKAVATIKLPRIGYPFKSGEGEITIYTINLTRRGYYLLPLKYYYLHIVSDYEIPGEGLYVAGSTVKISNTVIDHGNGTRRVFVKWSVDAMVSTTDGSVVMDSPKSVKAEWKTQYYLTVLSEYGEVEGSGWYDEGTTATISVAKTVVSSGNIFFNKVFKGWRDQTGTIVSTQPTYTFAVNTPRSLTAVWEDQLNIIPIIVIAIIVASGIICVVLYIFLRRTKEAPPLPSTD